MAVRLTVKVIGYSPGLFSRRVFEFDLPEGSTMKDVFIRLSSEAHDGYDKAIYDRERGKMNEYLAVFLNSREIRSIGGPGTPVKDGDTVTIIPPMAGG